MKPDAMKLIFLPVLALTLLSCPLFARTFTNLKGQKIEGTIVAADALHVEIERSDRRKFKIPLADLSQEDRLFCEEWRVANPPMKLTVKVDAVTAAGTRRTINSSERDNSSSAVSRTRVLEEGYKITLSNWSRDPGTRVAGLTVDYAIVVGYFNTAAKAADKRGVKEIVRGSATFADLVGTKGEVVLTKTVKTGQSAAVVSESSTDTSGERTSSTAGAVYRESMDGITLVVRKGDRIVATYTTGKVPRELPLELQQPRN